MITTFKASEPMNKEQLGRAIGRIVSGVYVVTLARNGRREGMLTTFLTQTGFAPPMLALAVKKERPILQDLTNTSSFAVNVLSKKNMDIFKNFAKPYAEGLDRFENLSVELDEFDNPIFKESVAWLACTVQGQLESGDHLVIVGEIIGGAAINLENEPMVHLRSNGFNY